MAFDEAQQVFDDSQAVVIADDDHALSEPRFHIIGASSTRPLLVVYAERDGETIRIISAREAEPYERRVYYGG
ncbi:MAG: BrnT family toxin [Acidobacteriota bacterium]